MAYEFSAGNLSEVLGLSAFFGFPGGVSGAALLLLRSVLGAALFFQASSYLHGNGAFGELACGSAVLICGALLMLGLMTPVAIVVVVLCTAGAEFSLLPACGPMAFDSKLSAIFAGAILTAVLLLGPGAFSLDARLFGRRHIIIPPRSR